MRRFEALLAVFLMIPGLAVAENPPPFKDFKFKRVKPPKPGAKNRITVQIAPSTPDAPAIAAKPDAPAAPADLSDWYWSGFSPKLADAGAGRLPAALKQLDARPGGVRAPRLQDLQNIASVHGIDILKATIGTKVSPALALAVISVESGGRSDAVSTAGATGLMQLMPATAERFGVADASVAADNIKGGVAYLHFLMNRFDSDPAMVLAAYNAGENAVIKNDGVPPYAETRAYVPKVLAAWTVAKGLCLTPPQLLSDGCVFNVQKVRSDG